MRLMAVKSKQCANMKNKYYCPEVFLDAVASKLASTAVLFLNVELLSEFYYNFPRELDQRLGRHLSDRPGRPVRQGGPQDQAPPRGHPAKRASRDGPGEDGQPATTRRRQQQQ